MKVTPGQLAAVYAVLLILAAGYLFVIEEAHGDYFSVDSGGRDHKFSFFDVSLFVVFFVAAALSWVSFMAYSKKNTERLMFVAFAFFLFALKGALKIIENFVIGPYGYLGISIQSLEVLILLSLFFALLRK